MKDPGECALAPASSPARPKKARPADVASRGSIARPANAAIAVVAAQPVPVTEPRSEWPLWQRITLFPSVIKSTGPVIAEDLVDGRRPGEDLRPGVPTQSQHSVCDGRIADFPAAGIIVSKLPDGIGRHSEFKNALPAVELSIFIITSVVNVEKK